MIYLETLFIRVKTWKQTNKTHRFLICILLMFVAYKRQKSKNPEWLKVKEKENISTKTVKRK